MSLKFGTLPLALGLLAACADTPAPDSEAIVATTTEAIVDGTDSGPEQNFVVGIQEAGVVLCSGVAVTPTLVLTARHCVVAGDEIGTDFDSTCRLGTNIGSPSSYKIVIGNDKRAPVAVLNVKRLIVDFSKRTCADDIAAIELETPISGVTFPRLRLDTLPNAGETAIGVGWGSINRTVGGTFPDVRKQQTAKFLQIDGTSFDTPVGTRLVPDGMLVSDISGCTGDSGGPALDTSGNGVAIMSGGASVREADDPVNCKGAFTLLVSFARQTAFIERAHQAVGLMPRRTGRADPGNLGATCEKNLDCNSNYCVSAGDRNVCSRACSATDACGTGFECSSAPGTFSICLPIEQKPVASCDVVPGAPPFAPGAFVIVAFGWLSQRIRRRRTNA